MIETTRRADVLLRAAFCAFTLVAASPSSSAQCAVGLTPAAPPSAQDGSGDIALGDLDGVHGPDAVLVRGPYDEVVVLLNDGSGELVPSPRPAIPVSSPVGVSLGDFDGIHGDDILVSQSSPRNASIFYNDGAGDFVPGPVLPLNSAPRNTLAVDLDGRNGVDVVVELFNGVVWFLADGAGGFGPPRFLSFLLFPTVAIGDFDDRHGPDLAVAVQTGPTSGYVDIRLNDGNGSFSRAPGAPYPALVSPIRIAAGELNGVPGDDIVYADGHSTTGYTTEVMSNDGAARFSRSQIDALPFTTTPWSIQLADMDGSGLADVVSTSIGNTLTTPGQGIRIHLNDGAGNFQLSAESPIHKTPIYFAATGDLDGRLGPDLVTSTSRTVEVLLTASATHGEPGQNLFGIHRNGTSLNPAGLACPTVDLSAGGVFELDVEGRAPGLPAWVIFEPGRCSTRPPGPLAFGPIPAATGYSIPSNCAAGSNRVLNLPMAPVSITLGLGSLAFDPGRGRFVTRRSLSLAPSAGSGTVAAQALVLDASVPGGVVLTNAVNLRY